MKNHQITGKFLFVVSVVCLLGISTFDTYSQTRTIQDTIKVLLKKAVRYQNGINCEVDAGKALPLYRIAAKKGSVIALNELGKIYRSGDGAKRDLKIAFNLFHKAAGLGSSSAMCNLALMYQKGEGTLQDYSKAYNWYESALKKGNPKGYYGAGYLLYKGLGVQQDYTKAVEYFSVGADKGHAGCSYMLACYYMAGHDDKQNIEKGKLHMDKALKHGHGWIPDVTGHRLADSLKNRSRLKPDAWTDYRRGRIGMEKKKLENNASESDLQGEWTGTVYTYDWSGKKIEEENKLKISISSEGGKLALRWYDGEKLLTTYRADRRGRIWIDTAKVDFKSEIRWFIYRSRFDITKTKNGDILFADFLRLNMDTREPLKPVSAVLERIHSGDNEDVNPIVINRISPNPFAEKIKLCFSLKESQKIAVEVFDIQGTKVFSLPAVTYSEGDNETELRILLNKGNYLLYLKGEKYSCSKTIIRK